MSLPTHMAAPPFAALPSSAICVLSLSGYLERGNLNCVRPRPRPLLRSDRRILGGRAWSPAAMSVGAGWRMPHVLTVAGSDSGGGAGIQADLKACGALGAFCSSVITAVTAQNTVGVQGVHPVPEEFVAEQLRSVLSDMSVDVV